MRLALPTDAVESPHEGHVSRSIVIKFTAILKLFHHHRRFQVRFETHDWHRDGFWRLCVALRRTRVVTQSMETAFFRATVDDGN